MLVLRNVTAETVSHGTIEGYSIVIDGDRIVAVGRELAVPAGAAVLDLTGKVVTPGFIDAATRIGIHEDGNGAIGHDEDEATQSATPHLRAIDAVFPADVAMRDARNSGVTTCLVQPGNANVVGGECAIVKTCGSAAEDMAVNPAAGLKLSLVALSGRWGGEQRERSEAVAVLQAELQAAREYQRKRMEDADEPLDLKREAYQPILRGERPAFVHADENHDIDNALLLSSQWGYRSVIIGGAEAHLMADELAEAGVPVILSPTMVPRGADRRNASLFTPQILAAHGVRFALSTDHPTLPVRYLFVVAATAAREGLPVSAALRAITLAPAEILGIAGRVGSIDAGKDADLVVWSGHPFAVGSQVEQVFVNGQSVYENSAGGAGEGR